MSVASRIFRRPAYVLSAIALVAAALARPLSAAPSFGEIERMEQPDGSQVDVRTFGDEFYLRVEGLDGYTLVRDPKTLYICYAALNADGSAWLSTGVAYQGGVDKPATSPSFAGPGMRQGLDLNPAARARLRAAARASLGLDGETQAGPGALGKIAVENQPVDSVVKVTGVIILVDFPDVKSNFSKDQIDSLANQPGYSLNGNNGSVRDYWLAVSHGKYEYQLTVSEFYTAKNTKAYYDRAGGYAGGQELIKETVQAMYARGFDFTKFTTNSNGSVRGLNILYAGASGKVWGQGIWPHRASISTVTVGAAKVSGYMMTSIGTTGMTIGTFCHESGHLLFGWPDLYDYDSDSRGTGGYCLMSAQDYKNPQPPNAWFRSGQGWEQLIDLKAATNGLVSVPSNGRALYKYMNPSNTKEGFVIENIAKKGRWTRLPDDGLLVWHVDEGGNNSWQDRTSARHYRVSVVQADGKFDLEQDVNGGGANDLFHFGNNAALSSTSIPDDKWWNGSVSGLDIYNVSPVKDTMTFQLRGVPVSVAGDLPARAGMLVSGRRARLDLARPGHVRVTAAFPDGRRKVVADRPMEAGANLFDLRALPAGAYTLIADGEGFRSAAAAVLLEP